MDGIDIFYGAEVKFPAAAVVHHVRLEAFLHIVRCDLGVGDDYRIGIELQDVFYIERVVLVRVGEHDVIDAERIDVDVRGLWVGRNERIDKDGLPADFNAERGVPVECDFHTG